MRMKAIIGLMVLMTPMSVQAQTAVQDRIEAGQALATRLCSSCHVVTSGATGTGSDTAPPFAAIAAKRGDDFLQSFLMKPHGAMPPVDLSTKEIDELIAYIESLRK